MTNDELKRAIEVLTEHNAWRRGEQPYDDIPSVDMLLKPKETGEAIDFAVRAMNHLAEAEELLDKCEEALNFYARHHHHLNTTAPNWAREALTKLKQRKDIS